MATKYIDWIDTMSKPKRHHWWPMAQSRYWIDAENLVSVTRKNGTVFRAAPINIGVESELYTRFEDDDQKDTSIEEWFAKAIDGPARMMIEHLLEPKNISRQPFRSDPEKAKILKELGFQVNPYIERITLPNEVRKAIADYLAALLVRNPIYLKKLIKFHEDTTASSSLARNLALDNMIKLYELYADRIRRSVLIVSRRVGTAEYLYADGGVMVEEPWRTLHGIPFDMHAPLTPDIALQVLPIPDSDDLGSAAIMEATNQGVARQNRIILGGANRFVFSRQTPPSTFITKYFGVPAPKNIGYGFNNGRVTTSYDPVRT